MYACLLATLPVRRGIEHTFTHLNAVSADAVMVPLWLPSLSDWVRSLDSTQQFVSEASIYSITGLKFVWLVSGE